MNRTRFRDVSLEFYEIEMSHDSVGNIDSEVVSGIACALFVTKTRSQEPSSADRACAADAGTMKQMAAVIQSEGVFIDISP